MDGGEGRVERGVGVNRAGRQMRRQAGEGTGR